jgi:hypothetical protein
VYPTSGAWPVTSDVTGNSWQISQGSITMGVGTLNDTLASSWLNAHGGDGSVKPGRCIPTAGTNPFTQSSCVGATAAIPVQATPTVQTILWSDFTGGKPESSVEASDIVAVYWYLFPPDGAGTAGPVTYPADIVIDNLAFVP